MESIKATEDLKSTATSDITEITVHEITVGSDEGLIIGPALLAPLGNQEKLDVLFRRIHDQLHVKIPLDDLVWLQFPMGDPIPKSKDENGSGAVHLPATLYGHQTPESLHWQDGVKIYFKDKSLHVDYTRNPEARE
ncbi:uncharacterized protein L201_003630 [Kwoniella dendrophila CBS 6074]|uniref:Uncharacterized protein n=1 Tax=Kwoniella dendrophila CBS 6074 TaxID=1295534 RepID=A0AAX4JTN2_9TREE